MRKIVVSTIGLGVDSVMVSRFERRAGELQLKSDQGNKFYLDKLIKGSTLALNLNLYFSQYTERKSYWSHNNNEEFTSTLIISYISPEMLGLNNLAYSLFLTNALDLYQITDRKLSSNSGLSVN